MTICVTFFALDTKPSGKLISMGAVGSTLQHSVQLETVWKEDDSNYRTRIIKSKLFAT